MRMAWRNIRSRKFSSIKVTISLVFMIIIMCVFTAYTIALEEENTSIVNSYRSGHYYLIEKNEPLSKENFESIKNIKGINHINVYASYYPTEKIRDFSFNIDGTKYECAHSSYLLTDNPYGSSSLEVGLHTGAISFYENDTFITSSDRYEADYRWENPELIYAGDVKVTKGKVIISETFIKEFKLFDNLIDKELTVNFKGKSYTLQIDGILSEKYYKLTGNTNVPHIIMSKDSELFTDIASNRNTIYSTELYINDYMQSQNIAQSLIKNVGILNFSAGSEYGLAMATTVTIVNNVTIGVMSTVGIGIIFALTLNIIFSMRFQIAKKENYYGIISAYGIKDRKMFSILFFEMAILAVFAIIIAYMVSYALIYLVDYILSGMIGIGVVFTWANFLITLAVASAFTFTVIMVVTLINYGLLTKKRTIYLLKASIEQ